MVCSPRSLLPDRGRIGSTGGCSVRASQASAILLLVLPFVRSWLLGWIVLFFVGFFFIAHNAVANTLLQILVPDELRGRLMSVYGLIVVGVAQVVGASVGGLVAQLFGVGWAIGGAAAVLLLYLTLAFRRYPSCEPGQRLCYFAVAARSLDYAPTPPPGMPPASLRLDAAARDPPDAQYFGSLKPKSLPGRVPHTIFDDAMQSHLGSALLHAPLTRMSQEHREHAAPALRRCDVYRQHVRVTWWIV